MVTLLSASDRQIQLPIPIDVGHRQSSRISAHVVQVRLETAIAHLQRTLTLPLTEFATTKSTLLSALKSPVATATGPFPVE